MTLDRIVERKDIANNIKVVFSEHFLTDRVLYKNLKITGSGF